MRLWGGHELTQKDTPVQPYAGDCNGFGFVFLRVYSCFLVANIIREAGNPSRPSFLPG